MSMALSQAATQPQVAPGGPVDVVAPTQPRRICRIERDSNTRIVARRVCQTVAERDAERDENQRDAQEAVDRQWYRQQGDIPFSEFAMPLGTRFRSNGLSSRGLRGAHR